MAAMNATTLLSPIKQLSVEQSPGAGCPLSQEKKRTIFVFYLPVSPKKIQGLIKNTAIPLD